MKMMILFAAVLVAFFAGAVDARKGLKSDRIEMLYADTLEPVDNWIENLKHERNLGSCSSKNVGIDDNAMDASSTFPELREDIAEAFANNNDRYVVAIRMYDNYAQRQRLRSSNTTCQNPFYAHQEEVRRIIRAVNEMTEIEVRHNYLNLLFNGSRR